jgi:ketosteroid isomerase-like protein
MSNVTTMQELYAAFGRGDIATVLAGLADDIVWESEGPASLKTSGIRHGKSETMGFFAALAEEGLNPHLTISEFVASGDAVMTIGRYTATSRTTGKKFDTPIAHYGNSATAKSSATSASPTPPQPSKPKRRKAPAPPAKNCRIRLSAFDFLFANDRENV